jgi:hypothetical protein
MFMTTNLNELNSRNLGKEFGVGFLQAFAGLFAGLDGKLFFQTVSKNSKELGKSLSSIFDGMQEELSRAFDHANVNMSWSIAKRWIPLAIGFY